jgi:riboflavin biosynthesis pyrimidine reductase
VSRFLGSGLLERLQVTVAPLLIGGGCQGVVPPQVQQLIDALRPSSRLYRMGSDVLYDLNLLESEDADLFQDMTLVRIR